jgi:hypothetical protein
MFWVGVAAVAVFLMVVEAAWFGLFCLLSRRLSRKAGKYTAGLVVGAVFCLAIQLFGRAAEKVFLPVPAFFGQWFLGGLLASLLWPARWSTKAMD